MNMPNEEKYQRQYQFLKFSRYALVFLIFLLVAAVFWIIVSLFSSQNKLTITPELKELAEPLQPYIETTVIDRLEAKKQYNDSSLGDFPIYRVESQEGRTEYGIIEVDLSK